jgi:HK97 family phage portal protein/2'-5' RNA ligase
VAIFPFNLIRRARTSRSARSLRANSNPLLGLLLSPDGHMQPIKGYGGANYSSGYVDFMQRAPGELRADETGLLSAYFSSVFAFRCLRVRARKVASLPRQLIDKRTGNPVDYDPIERAVTWAYRNYQQDVFYNWAHSRGMWGETFIEPVQDLLGRVGGLRWLNPLAVNVYETNGRIDYFDYYDHGGYVTRFMPNEIIFERDFNPANDLRGVGLLQQALDAINVDRNVQSYIRSYFRNGAQPGLMFTPKAGSLSPQDLEAVKQALQDDAKGVENWFNPFVMPVPFDVTTFTPPELEDQVLLRQDTREEIAAAIGVPLGLVMHNESKYQLSEEQRATFYEEEIIPEAGQLSAATTALVLPHFRLSPDDYEYRLDTTQLKTRVQDEKVKTELVTAQYTAGLLTYHQSVTELGRPKPEGEDFVLMRADLLRVPISQLANFSAFAPPIPMADINAPQLPTETQPAIQTVEPTPQPDMDSVWVGLYFENNPDLIALQKRLKAMYPDEGARWNEPSEFHITLAYAPAATDAQVQAAQEALAQVDVPEIAVSLASLRSFDSVGEHALHFRIRRNSDLIDLQETVHDALEGAGIALSSYSDPTQYKPHITMGYLPSKPRMTPFGGRVTVRPTSCALCQNEDIIATLGATDDEERTQKAIDELGAWQRHAGNNGAVKSADRFEAAYVPVHVTTWVREELRGMADKAAIRSLFDDARFIVALKAYATTRANFVDEAFTIIRAAQADESTRGQFASRLRALLRRYGLIALRDGMNEVGYDPESLGEKELAAFRTWQARQSDYVTHFGAEIFKQGITEAETRQRAEMWASMSLEDIRQWGLLLGDKERPIKWVLGNTEKHCADCLRLNGQVHTMQEWLDSGYTPTSGKTECKSYNCDCRLVPTDEAFQGNF